MTPRTRLICCLLAAGLVLTLFVSAPGAGGVLLPPWDKLGHFAFYGAVAVLVAAGFGPSRWPAALINVGLIGIADEAYQSVLPGRHADWGDLAMDFFAAAVGVLGVRWYYARRRRTDPV